MKIRFDPAKYLFFTSAAALVFAYGVAVGALGIFPANLLLFGGDSLLRVWTERETLLGLRPDLHLHAARYAGSGVTHVDEPRMSPGLTLLSGFFEGNNEIRLVRQDGVPVRRWPVRFSDIFPDPDHIIPADERPATDWNIDIHGAGALQDGSVVFNFEYGGMVKLDRCGDLEWKLALRTHHSVEMSDEGTLWVPVRRWVVEPLPGLPYAPPFSVDGLLELADDGRILREISVLDIFLENDLQALILATGTFDVGGPQGPNREIVHLNDIQPLGAELAAAFPDFAAGDLALSFRQFNLIMVVDPTTRRVKWQQTGPWIRQHDPDFLPNGRISLFNNNSDDHEGEVFGGSNIVEIDPTTRETLVHHALVGGQKWYTNARGKHQILPNGNTLVTESYSGRVFEVTRLGDVVWEFINRYDDLDVAHVNDAIRYPEDYFSVSDWACAD